MSVSVYFYVVESARTLCLSGKQVQNHYKNWRTTVRQFLKGETIEVIINKCLHLFQSRKLFGRPPQRATINVYNLHFLFVKIYNTISLKFIILTPKWLPLNYFTKTNALPYGSFWEEKHMEWLLMIALAIILITEYVWTRLSFDFHWYFLYNWNR